MGVVESRNCEERAMLSGIFLFLAFMVLESQGHGNMVWPPVWWDQGGAIGLTSGEHCTAGWQYHFGDGKDPFKVGVNCMWFTNWTFIPGEATLDQKFRTFANIQAFAANWTAKNPWMSPGSAQVFTPCGAAGGNPYGCPNGSEPSRGFDCGLPYGGAYAYGPKVEDVAFEDVVTTEWTAGQKALVGWGMIANHGGGYQYRLCKMPEEGKSQLSEECFQQLPLDFASDMQWVQFGPDPSTKIEFKANRTSKGTTPSGSTWTKNPIPNCAGLGGGYFDPTPDCPEGLQFPAPAPGLLGQGSSIVAQTPQFKWSLMDEVLVPEHLEHGDYVLSFRWDCEQTPQIWNSCANIKILSPNP